MNEATHHARVAVIIVNWNGGELLMRCLRALRAQTVLPEKIIVVDNASSDGSGERAQAEFPEVTVVLSPRNLGFAAGNNLAVAHAGDCEWLALLNPDAFAEPQWLAALLEAAKRQDDYAFFGSRMLMADTPALLDGVGDAYHVSGLVWREGHGRAQTGNYLEEREIFSACAAAALYKRTAFAQAGGFDEDYFCYVEDIDLSFRLRLLGYRCLYVPTSIVLHKGSALTGKKSDFSIFYGHRNLVWTFVKNFPAGWFWLYLPLHLAMNFATLAALVASGHGAPAFKAKLAALCGLPRAWKKRRAVQHTARVPFAHLRPLMARGLMRLLTRDKN